MFMTVLAAIIGAVALMVLLIRLRARLALSLAKHRSLAGHPRMARRIAALMPFYDYDEQQFFRADDAPDDVAARRRDGLRRLSGFWRQRFARTLALTAETAAGVSDLQFTAAYACHFSSAGWSGSICRPVHFWHRRPA
jgi:glutamate-1-semialdehyde 2,1-aminomutase